MQNDNPTPERSGLDSVGPIQNPKSKIQNGLPSPRPGDPCVMVAYGGRGDLARRKLVPSLYNLARNGYLNRQFALIGLARTEMSDAS